MQQKKVLGFSSSIIIITVLIAFASGCKKDTASPLTQDYGFIVTGSTGNKVMLDLTWYQDCNSDGNGGWTKGMRTLSKNELSTTIYNYQNTSTTSDCTNGLCMVTTFVQTLTNDNIRVPITWTDAAGNPASAPAGLENVKEGNGATGVVTYATITPLTAAQASALNSVSYMGYTDWTSGDTKDVLPVFAAIGPAKGTIVVDDRNNPGIGSVYDGTSTDPKKYPTTVVNASPFRGKLNGIKF
jgi:hypothetical protein